MALTKAKIKIVDKKGIIKSHGKDYDSFDVQFNPTEYTLNRTNQIAEIAIPGLDNPLLQFIRGQNEKLTLDLFFDVRQIRPTEQDRGVKDVTVLTDRIYQLAKIHPDLHAPPRIQFLWSKRLSFTAIVESVQQKFELFDPDGIPLRATLSVVFRQFETLADQVKRLNLKSSDHTKLWVVKRGDTLSSIAAEEYDDPCEWRHIADHNSINNPRRLVPGSVLEIPPLDLFGGSISRNS